MTSPLGMAGQFETATNIRSPAKFCATKNPRHRTIPTPGDCEQRMSTNLEAAPPSPTFSAPGRYPEYFLANEDFLSTKSSQTMDYDMESKVRYEFHRLVEGATTSSTGASQRSSRFCYMYLLSMVDPSLGCNGSNGLIFTPLPWIFLVRQI